MDKRENSFDFIRTFEGLSITKYPLLIASFLNDLTVIPRMVSAEIEYLDNEFLWIAFGNDPEGIWYIGIYQIEIISNNQAKFEGFYLSFVLASFTPFALSGNLSMLVLGLFRVT